MVKLKPSHRPTICIRPIKPSDLEILEQIHVELFPIRYETEFYKNVVNGRDIVSWAAIDLSRPADRCDELIGFVTTKIGLAEESEISDLLRYDPANSDQALHILTLGVVEGYRNFGIASSLIREVIKYASSIPNCRAAYLHVISYNNPAIHLYKKTSFKCIRKLSGFYLIDGQHYDAYLFVYYVNGGRSPCSPLELVSLLVSYVSSGTKSLATRLRKSDNKALKWAKCKETRSLMPTHSKRSITSDDYTGCECV
ncbi:hypothetical protein ACFE04_028029 [Oxalis oulophora]